MDKQKAVQYLFDNRIVAIIRADSSNDLINAVDAIAQGGLKCIEITMTTPGALKCIEEASKKFDGTDVLMGVGSVLDAETCRMAILAGAKYVVTPTLSIDTIKMARRYSIPIIPGAFTPTEILTAWENGADLVKVFPSSLGGPSYIKAIKGPMPQIELVATGGVRANNVHEFFNAGASLVAVGGNLATKELLENRDFNAITKNAKEFYDAVEAART